MKILELLRECKDYVVSQDHEWGCPRGRDDHTCTCGKDELESELIEAISEME